MDDTKKQIGSDALGEGGKAQPRQEFTSDLVEDQTVLLPPIKDAETELIEMREKAYSDAATNQDKEEDDGFEG